jgi:cation diffusion facilitator CzcD-associated flavoprotein CzcO
LEVCILQERPWITINGALMNSIHRGFILLATFSLQAAEKKFSWAIIGAGHAGITSISVLLENGILENEIVWIDPEFNVGRLGKYYGNVPSNLKVHRYTNFLNRCSFFQTINSTAIEAIKNYNQQEEPRLQLIIDALQDITNYLRSRVTTYIDNVHSISAKEGGNSWDIKLDQNPHINADKVILAIGSRPKKMAYTTSEIPLDLALDENILKSMISAEDTIMVIGSAHSAILILKYLSEIPVKKIINVYSKQPTYGELGGLEGITAYWAKEVLEKNPPHNLIRIKYHEGVIENYLQECTKIIYAFGYERNSFTVNNSNELSIDGETGIIEPHLYGIGFAFPEYHINEAGLAIPLIGVNSFMKYAQQRVPLWIKD